MVEEQSAKIIKHPTEPGKLIVDEKFLMEFVRNTADVMKERDQHRDTLQDASADFNKIKEAIKFFDSKLGLFDMMKPGKKMSITGITGKLIKTYNDITRNPHEYKKTGEEINHIIKKVTSENYVLNHIGQRQLSQHAGTATGEHTHATGTGNGTTEQHTERQPISRWQRFGRWCAGWWPRKIGV